MANDEADVAKVAADNEGLEAAIALLNDAVFGLAGIFSRALVEADVIGREKLADLIEHRAGNVGADDHNELLFAFARAVRMNLPGGRFEVIEGGRSSKLDPR